MAEVPVFRASMLKRAALVVAATLVNLRFLSPLLWRHGSSFALELLVFLWLVNLGVVLDAWLRIKGTDLLAKAKELAG